MNEFCELFLHVNNHSTITLEKNKTYHVYQDDSFTVDGYYCSNTAKKDENPAGLRFSAIYLKGMKDIVIDGNGAEILVHGKMTPIVLDKCENVTIKNLSIDYACPTMSEFKVLSCSKGEYVLKINDECLFEIEDNVLYWHGEKDKNGTYYWRDTNSGFKRYIKLFDPEKKLSYDFNRDDLTFESVEKLTESTIRVTLKNKDISLPIGGIFQSRSIVRDQVGALIQRCKNVNFENMRV